MFKIPDITITSIETITKCNILTGALDWVADELQEGTISNTEETSDITGKQGRLLNTLKRNKAVTIKATNGLISGGMMESQTGSKFEHKVTSVMYPEYLTVSSDKATTTYKACGTKGNEIESVYIHNSNNTLGKQFTQDATVSTGKFTYDPDTKEIAFNAGDLEDGTEIAVYYFRNINADVLDNRSDVYSEKGIFYIDALGEDICGRVYRIQFYIPKGDVSGNFDIAMGKDQSVHALEVRSLAGSCGAGGSLWRYTIFGVDEPDAE